MQIRIVFLLFLAHSFFHSKSERIKCQWLSEYLCGDKCLPVNSNCTCGNETITFDDSGWYTCCNARSCFYDTFDRNVKCLDGIKHNWGMACNNVCKQMAQYGFSTLSCDYVQDLVEDQCYMGVNACRGNRECYD